MARRTRQTLRDRLLAEMEAVRTVDCHSHTMLEREYRKAGGFDLFNYMAYFNRDIESVANQPPHQALAGHTDDERWARLKAILQQSRNVSYWRHNVVVYRSLFGLRAHDLTDRNWRGLNQRIKSKTAQPDWYRHVTEDVCRLRTQVLNVPWFGDWEPRYFTAILRMEGALGIQDSVTRQGLEEVTNVSIDSLAAARDALAALVEDYRGRGARGIKLAHAYGRTLHSEPVSHAVASRVFDKALRGKSLTAAETKKLQDHVIFFLAGLAGDLDVVFQIHTGVQGNWGNIPDSDPLLLLPLIRAHPKVRFDLFHAGYPYSRQLGMLGKHYRNVWLNMCWMYVITMAGSRQILSEWIDLVPGHRLLGFGSDVHFPEFVLGHLLMARACLADVLADKVRRDFLSESAALDLARMMLHDNPADLYRL